MEKVANTGRLLTLWQLGRPRNALPSLLAFLTGIVVINPTSIGLGIVGLTSASLVLLNLVLTIQNDMYDVEVDRVNKQKSSLLVGAFDRNQLNIIVRYGLLAVVMLPLLVRCIDVALVLGALILLGILYNCPPYQASHRPIASLLILTTVFSVVPFGLGIYVAGGVFSGEILLLAVAFFLYRWSTSSMKDYKDVVGDTKHAKRTFLLAYGPKLTKRLTIGAATLGCSGLLIAMFMLRGAASFAAAMLLCCLALCAAYVVGLRWQLANHTVRYEKNHRLFQRIVMLQIALELGILLWFYSF